MFSEVNYMSEKTIKIVAIVNEDRTVTYTASIEVLGEPRK